MTEKEKMLSGLLYNADTSELLEERSLAAKMCFEYNHTSPDDAEKGRQILNQLLGKLGADSCIQRNFFCDYGYNIEIGKKFFANYNLVILDCAKVTIGDNVFIGPNVGIYTAEHPLDGAERRQGLEFAKPITIGNDAWIGGNAVILGGVTIGSNCVIGAGSVVTKDIPDNSVAVGNPCKIIKNI